MNFKSNHISELGLLRILLLDHLIDDIHDLAEDSLLGLASINDLQTVALLVLISKLLEPSVHGLFLQVKGNETVHNSTAVIALIKERLKSLTQRCLVYRWLDISHMIDKLRGLSIKSSSIGASLTLLRLKREPNHRVNTTLNQSLWWSLLSSGLN